MNTRPRPLMTLFAVLLTLATACAEDRSPATEQAPDLSTEPDEDTRPEDTPDQEIPDTSGDMDVPPDEDLTDLTDTWSDDEDPPFEEPDLLTCPEPAACDPIDDSCRSNIFEGCVEDDQGCLVTRFLDCNQEGGLCSLSLGGCAASDDQGLEPNDSPDQAADLVDAQIIQGAALGQDDEDWYRLTLDAPGVVFAELRRADSQGEVRLDLCQAEDPDACRQGPGRAATDEPARWTQRSDAATSYLVRVTAGGSKPYQLRVAVQAWQSISPAARFHEAPTVVVPAALRASPEAGGEQWIALQSPSAGILTLEGLTPQMTLRLCDPRFPGRCSVLENEASSAGTVRFPMARPADLFLVVTDVGEEPFEAFLDLDPQDLTCAPGQHDGGDGQCLARGQCSANFHLDGHDLCVPEGECAPEATLTASGACVAWQPFAATTGAHSAPTVLVSADAVYVLTEDTTAPGEIYTFAQNQWTPLPQAPAELVGSTPCLLGAGDILWVGGSSRTPAPALIYSPQTQMWTQTPVSPAVWQNPACLPGADDDALVLLGGAQAQVHSYDANTNTWSPRPSLRRAYQDGRALRLTDSILVSGQPVVPEGNNATLSEVYDFEQAQWTDTRRQDAPHIASTLVQLQGGLVMALGGSRDQRDSAQVGIYNPEDKSWRATAPMPRPIGAALAWPLADGNLLVVGREDASYLFDVQQETWTGGPRLWMARDGAALVGLPSGGGLLLGGRPTQGGAPQTHPEWIPAWP